MLARGIPKTLAAALNRLSRLFRRSRAESWHAPLTACVQKKKISDYEYRLARVLGTPCICSCTSLIEGVKKNADSLISD